MRWMIFGGSCCAEYGEFRGLTFELRRDQRRDARARLAKMYRVPPDRAWWPAVGARLERGVRHRIYYRPNCSHYYGRIAAYTVRQDDLARTEFVFLYLY